MPEQKTMWTRCLGGFSVMWVTKFLISPVKKGIFCPKRPNLAENWHFWSIWAWPCRLIQCPVDRSVGGCGARAVSRKIPIYFIDVNIMMTKMVMVTMMLWQQGAAVAQMLSRHLPSGRWSLTTSARAQILTLYLDNFLEMMILVRKMMMMTLNQ